MTDKMEHSAEGPSAEPQINLPRQRRVSIVTVLLLAVAAGVAAMAAGCRPTGTHFIDPLLAALFAALVTCVCSRASRETLLLFSAVVLVMSRGWLELPAATALLIAFASMFPRYSRRRVGALIGALGVEVLLRWPSTTFHGFTAVVAVAVLVPVFISAYRHLSTTGRQRAKKVALLTGTLAIVLTAPVVLAVALARTDITAGQRAAQTAFDDVSSGNVAEATPQLRTAGADIEDVSSTLGSWWTSVSRLVPVVAQQRQALVTGAATAQYLVAAAAREVPSLDYRALKYDHGQIDLGRISAMLGPARTLEASLSVATARLAGLRSPWLLGPIQSRLATFDKTLGRARSNADLVVKAIPVVPDMLGAAGPQHYFLAFVSPSESRGLDGIVAAYGELTAVHGHISLTVSGPVESLNNALPHGGGALRGLTDFMARYGQFDPGRFFQDATYSPDFPTVAEVISQLYPQAGGDQVDGVLMVDPYGLARLLSITGPVSVPGLPLPLTSHNASEVLLKGQYLTGLAQSSRHDVLQLALHATFQRLVNGSLPGPRTLSNKLEPAVLDGRLAFWSAHSIDRPLLAALHLDDAFPKAKDGDLLAVTTQNADGNKIDAYLHTAIADHVTFNPTTGAESAEVQVTLTNDAPATGLPPLVIDSPSVPGLAPGTNETWLSIYSPLSFDEGTVDGTPSTMSATRELGVWAYSTYIDVPPHASVTLRMRLIGQMASGSSYRLSVQLQPSANPERARVVVTPANPWNLAASSGPPVWNLGSAVRQDKVFRFAAN